MLSPEKGEQQDPEDPRYVRVFQMRRDKRRGKIYQLEIALIEAEAAQARQESERADRELAALRERFEALFAEARPLIARRDNNAWVVHHKREELSGRGEHMRQAAVSYASHTAPITLRAAADVEVWGFTIALPSPLPPSPP